jgi:glutathione S-transferase
MHRLYGDPYSGNCYKVKLVMAQLGIAHEWSDIDITKRQSRSAEFLAKNPAGQIPLLELDSGEFLPESNAILHFLADGSALLPQDRLQHAQVLQWMFFEQYTHEPSVAVARYIVRYLGRPPEHEELLQRKIADSYEALAIMEGHLASRPYFVAGRYSIADIALFAYTHVAHEGHVDLAGFPAVRAWIARVQAQPNHVAMGA